MRPRRISKLLASALGLIALGFVWFYLAPTPLGGSTTYVVTHGISMEPRFHTGDLAIVRSQSTYHVGEIVAYHSNMLHTIVLHRIVGREGNRYIFKGDNNHFIDPERPLASQLIGALWIHIPGAGVRLQTIRSPAVMGGLIFVGILLLMGGAFTRKRRRRERPRGMGEGAVRVPRSLPAPSAPTLGVVAVGTLALLPFVVLALVAFADAPSARDSFTVPYKQSGALSYSGVAAPSPVYPDDRVVTGDPLFTQVVGSVHVRFAYRFESAVKQSLTGRGALWATLSSTNGWHNTFSLGAATNFHGDKAVVTGTLDLTSLLALVRSFEATTKTRSSYALVISPHVNVTGNVNGAPVQSAFSPEVRFELSEFELQPAAAEPSLFGGHQSKTSPFAPSGTGSVSGSQTQPHYLSLGIARLSVDSARAVALSAIVIVLGALVAALTLLRPLLSLMRKPRRDKLGSFLARYGELIVPVAQVRPLPGVPVIDVADIDALARIADHYERSILHETAAGHEAFWVTDESGQFRYAPDPSTQAAPARMAARDEDVLARLASNVNGTDAQPGEAQVPTAEHQPAAIAPQMPTAEPQPAASAPQMPTAEPQPAAMASQMPTAEHQNAAQMPTAEHQARAVAAALPAQQGIEQQHWAAAVEGQPAPWPAPSLGDAGGAGLDADAPAQDSRAQARAAFARVTGLRWSAGS